MLMLLSTFPLNLLRSSRSAAPLVVLLLLLVPLSFNSVSTALPIMSLSIPQRLKADTTIKISYDGDSGFETPKYIVGYWSIRGLSAPIRMLLSAAQVNHWVALYDSLEDGETGWIRAAWTTDKAWMKDEHNAFMNLPYLVDCTDTDGDCFIINQSNAILTHLGRELNLLGTTKAEHAKCEELLGELMDLRNHMVRFAYSGTCDKADAQKLLETCHGIFDKLELHFTQKTTTTTTYLVGETLSAPDFHLWELLDQFHGLCEYYSLPSIAVNRPLLGQFHTTFVTLPENEAYFTSTTGDGVLYSSLPYNNPYARFGSNPLTTPDEEQKRFGHYTRGQATPWMQKGVVHESRTKTNSCSTSLPQKRKGE